MLAASEGNHGVVQVLVKAGANLDLQSNVCVTCCSAVCVNHPIVNDPIFWLISFLCKQIVCTSCMRKWNKSQRFCFCLAKWVVAQECYIIYLSFYNVCCHTQEGNSALMAAAYSGKTDVVMELVKAGANLDLQNKVWQK